MPLPFRRADRVGDSIRRELSRLLLREVKDPRLSQVVVTAVQVSPDLRHARIFFTAGTGGTDRQAELPRPAGGRRFPAGAAGAG